MKSLWPRLIPAALLPLAAAGCSAVGGVFQGVAHIIGVALMVAASLAGPALAYYLWRRSR